MPWASGAALAFGRAFWRLMLDIKARRSGRTARTITLLYAALVLSVGLEAQTRPTRRVLILNETGTSYPAINIIDQGIRAGLQDAPYRLEFYREYMETVLFPDPETQQEFRAFYLRKYQNRKPDVIIAVGPAPLQFMLDAHERAFAGVPVIFCLPYGPIPDTLTLDPGITGVTNTVEPAATLEVALRLKPKTKRVIIVGGTSTLDRQTQAMVQQGLRSYTGRLDISYLTNLTMSALLEQLRHVPGDAIILLSGILQDAAGTSFSGIESAQAVTAAASAPVFVLTDSFLGHGEVGGKLFTRFEQGKVTGKMSLRALNGEKPRDMPVVNGVTQYMFDWRALKRWGLNEKNLPVGSVVLNRQPTFWELYWRYAITGAALLFVQMLAILGLLRQRAKRRIAQTELIRSTDQLRESEERFRLVANTAPVTIWMTDVNGNCTYANQHWLEFTGRSFESQLGMGWTEQIHPEDLALSWETFKKASDQRKPFRSERRTRRHDGEYRWMLASGVPRFDKDGSFAGYIGSAIDITERKTAEEALSTVSQKLVEAHEEERTRLARDLHDDINQRIALLAVTLERLKESLPAGAVESRLQTLEAGKEVTDIGEEIQVLSHRLHSSKLELLGLAGAAASFCKEVSSRQGVEIDFHSEDVPKELPDEVAVSLFRVLQEALQNAIKHSGSRHFRVSLKRAANIIELTVQDSGIGFEPEMAIKGHGLGLISMKERLRLVGGQLFVESKPQHGATIRACIGFEDGAKVRTVGMISSPKERGRIAGRFRVLVVEDYEPFLRFVCSALQGRDAEFDVTQASDGLEAVQKAVTFEPDLILLDIGLPGMHGFEAAEQMRSLVPHAKILFVSQESSSEVIREAFRIGGQGYVLKSSAHRDLMHAVDVVLGGERFVSSSLEFGDTTSTSSDAMPRLVVAENHVGMREMIAKVLQTDFDVVATVETGLAALEEVSKLKPDVLVMDVLMNGLEGPEVARQLKDHGNKTKIVFVSASMEATQISACLMAGGHAYVSKMRIGTDLPIAIRKTLAGEGFVSPV